MVPTLISQTIIQIINPADFKVFVIEIRLMLSHSFMLLLVCDWKYSVTLYGMYEIFFSGWKKKE